ncbi:MAG: MotE family protein [Rhizobiaceae bacterium]|nr:MotE family protein [Rhizobiaceae bacterium]
MTHLTLSRTLRLSTAACLLFLAGPAATQETPVASNDVERFCTNITDAARDQRYALQAEELRNLQAEVDARIAALEEKRAEYEEWLSRRETFLAKARDNIVDIYGRMRPDAAAERLTELGPELAAGILMKLDARKAGIIMNEMETKAAAGVTSIMASAAREKDPS